MLHPDEIMRELQREYTGTAIEGHWFADAELSVTLADGVPESVEHSLERGRFNDDGYWGQPVDGRDSWQLDNYWKNGLIDPRR